MSEHERERTVADARGADASRSVSSVGQPAGVYVAVVEDWSPQRLQLSQWFEVNAPALAPVYAAVVRMASDPAFPGRVWFIAHALRDIRNRLPDALAGASDGSKTEYSDLAEQVAKRWIQDGLPADGSSPLSAATEPSTFGLGRFEISQALLAAVSDMVVGHLAIAPRKQDNARRLFQAVAGGPVPDYVVKSWITATNRAERFAHLRDKPLSKEDEEAFEGIFAACERALVAMANWSYANMDDLDEILGSANQ